MSKIDVRPVAINHGGHVVSLLEIKIDGELVSSEFPPFDASASSVISSICLECFVSSRGAILICANLPEGFDSHDDIGIRRHKGKIVWFYQHDAWSFHETPNAVKNKMWHFEVAEYESQLGGDSSRLPEFNSMDIQRVLKLTRNTNANNAIYRIPMCKSDPNGRELMQLIQGLQNDAGLRIVDAPDDVMPYEIGFERNCDPEVVFEAGFVGDTYALKLIRNPAFLFWVTSETINQRFPKIAE